jgi:hypothetical protein
MTTRLVLVLALLPGVAFAQARRVPGFELERFAPNPGGRETLTLATGDLLAEKTLRLSLLGHYQASPLVLTVDGMTAGKAVGYRMTAHLLVAYAITSWAEVSLALSVVLAQGGDDFSAYGFGAVPAVALGAPWLGGRFGLLRQADGKPLDFAVQVGVSVPLGSAEGLTKDPGPGLAGRVQLGAGRTLADVLRVGVEVGALVRAAQDLSPASTAVLDQVGSAFVGGVALSTTGHALRGELSFRGQMPSTAAPASAEVLLGARYTFLRDFEVSALGGPGLGRAPGTPAFRVLVGFAWVPSSGEVNDAREPAAKE